MGDEISAILMPASIMWVRTGFFKGCGLVVKEVCDLPDLELKWA
jgi:hypothetical protein